MRIALVHPYHWSEVRRGGERYLGDLAWYFVQAGHEVDVLTTVPDGSMTWVEDGVTVRAARRVEPPIVKNRGLGAVQTHALSVLPTLLRRRYDLVHALTPWGVLAARAARHRVVYTEIGHPFPEAETFPPGGRRLYRAAVRAAHRTTALSESAAAGIEAITGRRPVVQPPGVRLDVFAHEGDERSQPPVVLFVSDAAGWRKGPDLLVAAVHELRERRPDIRLCFAGPGDPADAIVRAGIDPDAARAWIDVAGVGERADLPARYATSSVTVLPSVYEAFGLALVESLATGTPVVCTDGWGMAEIVTDQRIGRRFPAGDRAALALAIDGVLDLAADPATGERCRSHAAKWSWIDTIGPAHAELYESVRLHRSAS